MKWFRIVSAIFVSLMAAHGQTGTSGSPDGQSQQGGLAVPAASPPLAGQTAKAGITPGGMPALPVQTYILTPNDMVQVKVYQEDDLETKLRISKDGTSSFPLIGVVNLGGKTIEQAAALIRDELAKDYLVNPQVTISVVEYAKRRFTVLGQVQKPGTYEIPNEESVTLLQAIAMAGGYTRLASKSNILVTRSIGEKKSTFSLDVNQATSNLSVGPFVIMPDDNITVPERLF